MSSNVKVKPQSQTYSSGGLYGSSTTNSYGTSYNPTDFEKKLINMTSAYIPQYMEQVVHPSYDSEIFKAQSKQRNRLANQAFENNVINPLASHGLTRGSSINQMSNQFANKLADLEVNAMADEDRRNLNILNNLMGYYQVPYEMMRGINGSSGNLYQRAVQNAANQNRITANDSWVSSLSDAARLFGNISQSYGKNHSTAGNASKVNWGSLAGSGLGYYFGGPGGAQIGSMLGGQIGEMF